MGFFDIERAENDYNKPSKGNMNQMLGEVNLTKYNEIKVSDHRVSYELARLNNNIERLLEIYESKD